MDEAVQPDNRIQSALSLDPLLAFWRSNIAPGCKYLGEMYQTFAQRIRQIDALQGDIQDPAVFQTHNDLIMPLMTVAFPASTWQTSIASAMPAFGHHPIYYTPSFKRLLMTEDGRLKGSFKPGERDERSYLRLRAFWLILDKIYDIRHDRNLPVTRIVQDADTGMDRYYRILPDWQFLEVEPVDITPPLSAAERTRLIENIDDPDVIGRIIPLGKFKFRGFVIVRAVDVTDSEVILALEKDLIDQETFFCTGGFGRLQERLRVLFNQPDLVAGMGAVQGDQVWAIHSRDQTHASCAFQNASHASLRELKASVWMRAVDQNRIIAIKDLTAEPMTCEIEEELVAAGIRSMLIAPLHYQGNAIGTIHIASPQPNRFGAMDKMMLKPIAPLFSMALRRGLDDIENQVQSIIKEKCTAVHPSVEWRFRREAFNHMGRLHIGQPSELEPIVFKDVIPLYGQCDIRGSAAARNKSIQADLTAQLALARDILDWAGQAKPWPLVKAYQLQVEQRLTRLGEGLFSNLETEIVNFLHDEIEPTFGDLMRLGPRVAQAIEKYNKAIDPQGGYVYSKRRAFENSVSMLNERLSTYLDQEEASVQKDFPHYFEKHRTDGLDYMVYVGASMREDGQFNHFHLKSLVLWQLLLACGMAWHTRQAKPEMQVPLETCHLVYFSTNPLSIRFRYDEKRFDVDGAYDVRYEIIKSRLDKALVKGGRERLTQPDRIAIVYSQPEEGEEMRRHISFMQSMGHLLDDLEPVDLEDLPGVRGLKALRVGVNLRSEAIAQRFEQRPDRVAATTG